MACNIPCQKKNAGRAKQTHVKCTRMMGMCMPRGLKLTNRKMASDLKMPWHSLAHCCWTNYAMLNFACPSFPRAWRAFTSGEGGGGVDRALWPGPPPKKAQLTIPPKTDPGTSVVPMTVVFVFKDTRPPVNSGYTCMLCPTGCRQNPCRGLASTLPHDVLLL